MFEFYWPWMALLLPLPIIIRYILPAGNNIASEESSEILFPYIDKLSDSFGTKTSTTKTSNKLFLILLSLLWFFLILSIMRPQHYKTLDHNNSKGYDIMLAVDISESMRALDFSTKTKKLSRLDVTKSVVSKFVHERKGDRMGLILFGEHAYLQTPMTFDKIALNQMLNNAEAGMAGASTSIGDAIGIAIREIRTKPKNSRVLILLTDGIDNSSNLPPIEAAKIAQHYNIRIYTIAIGKNGKVPYQDNFGNVHMIETGIDEELLKEIANLTGGKYFKATDNALLEEVYNEINELEKIDIETTQYKIYQPLYRYPLSISCILFISLCLMPLFRSNKYGF